MSLNKTQFASDILDVFKNACNFNDQGKVIYKEDSYDPGDYMAEAFYDVFKDFIESASITGTEEAGTVTTGELVYVGDTNSGSVSITSALKTSLKSAFNTQQDNFDLLLATAIATELSIGTTVQTSGSGSSTHPTTGAVTPTVSSGYGGIPCVSTVLSSKIRSVYFILESEAQKSTASVSSINKILADAIADGIVLMVSVSIPITLTLDPPGSGSTVVTIS